MGVVVSQIQSIAHPQLLRTQQQRSRSLRTIRVFHRLGFTLVELLVVIAVIGILVSLLLPAVQAAREAARRMQCRSHLKQIGLALHNYESTYRKLPAHSSFPVPGLGYQNPRGSWMTRILPYIEQDGVYKQYDQNINWHDVLNEVPVKSKLPIVSCPSAPVRDGFEWTVLVSYANASSTTPISGSRDFYYGATTDYANLGGIGTALNNSLPPTSQVADPLNSGIMKAEAISLAEVTDGLSNTILVAECAGRPRLYQKGKHVPDGTTPKTWAGSASVTRPFPTGGVWASHSKGFLIDGAQVNGFTNTVPGTCAVNCSNDNEIYAFHPGVANALLADGSVRSLEESMQLRTLIALVSRSGNETISE